MRPACPSRQRAAETYEDLLHRLLLAYSAADRILRAWLRGTGEEVNVLWLPFGVMDAVGERQRRRLRPGTYIVGFILRKSGLGGAKLPSPGDKARNSNYRHESVSLFPFAPAAFAA